MNGDHQDSLRRFGSPRNGSSTTNGMRQMPTLALDIPQSNRTRPRASSYQGVPGMGGLTRSQSAPQNGISPLMAGVTRDTSYGAGLYVSPRFGPSPAPPLSPGVMLTPGGTVRGLRTRALSETGKQLFLGSYSGRDLFDGANGVDEGSEETEMMEQDPLGGVKSKNKDNKKRRKKKKKSKSNADDEEGRSVNIYAMIGSDTEDEDQVLRDIFARNALGRQQSLSKKNPTPRNAPILESSVTEVGGSWETVLKKDKKKKKAVSESPMSPRQTPYGRSSHGYSSDDFDDLFDLQAPTFGARQVGSAKKTMQHKMAERRGYQIDKRNKQRASQQQQM